MDFCEFGISKGEVGEDLADIIIIPQLVRSL